MFVNKNSYGVHYEHKCSICGNNIRYSFNNLYVTNELIPKTGWKIKLYYKCDKCGHLEKISS